MKRFLWLWPVVALVAVAVYYVVDAFLIIPVHFTVDHHRFRWPPGTLGVVVQVVAYSTIIGMSTMVAGGALVAAFLYIKQNKPSRRGAIPQDK